MKELKFPLLTKDDIDVRIGQKSKKDPNKVSLLLYQDARCGMKYLDQVVGVGNWQKRYYECKGLVICAVSIYDEEKKQWVEKSDTGSAGDFEVEKSLASDSFKRVCVCWGLARELYTAPDIWVKTEGNYDKFFVKKIGYNANREICELFIANANGEIVYSYPKNAILDKPQTQPKQEKPLAEPFTETRKVIRFEDLTFIKNWLMTAPDNMIERFENWLFTNFETRNPDYLTEGQGAVVVKTLKEKYNA